MEQAKHTPSLAQMRARMNSGHRAVLEAARDGRKPTAQRLGDARGLMTCRATLVAWGAVDGDHLTDVGRALLAPPNATTLAGFREENPGTRRDEVCGGAA